MRVLIIQEKDVHALHERLELTKFTTKPGHNSTQICETLGMTEDQYKMVVEDVHRRFNYILRGWLVEQGGN